MSTSTLYVNGTAYDVTHVSYSEESREPSFFSRPEPGGWFDSCRPEGAPLLNDATIHLSADDIERVRGICQVMPHSHRLRARAVFMGIIFLEPLHGAVLCADVRPDEPTLPVFFESPAVVGCVRCGAERLYSSIRRVARAMGGKWRRHRCPRGTR